MFGLGTSWNEIVSSLNVGCDGPIIRLVENDSPFLFFSFGCTDRDDWDEHNFHIVSHREMWGLLTISRPHIFFLQNRLYTIAALWPAFLPHPLKLPLQSHLLELSS